MMYQSEIEPDRTEATTSSVHRGGVTMPATIIALATQPRPASSLMSGNVRQGFKLEHLCLRSSSS